MPRYEVRMTKKNKYLKEIGMWIYYSDGGMNDCGGSGMKTGGGCGVKRCRGECDKVSIQTDVGNFWNDYFSP